jgi:hypothetical protein
MLFFCYFPEKSETSPEWLTAKKYFQRVLLVFFTFLGISIVTMMVCQEVNSKWTSILALVSSLASILQYFPQILHTYSIKVRSLAFMGLESRIVEYVDHGHPIPRFFCHGLFLIHSTRNRLDVVGVILGSRGVTRIPTPLVLLLLEPKHHESRRRFSVAGCLDRPTRGRTRIHFQIKHKVTHVRRCSE